MIKLLVYGVCGKMGSRIFSLASKDPDIELVAGIEKRGHPETGNQITGTTCVVEDTIENHIKKIDVMIDFTAPESTLEHAKIAAQSGKPIVIGTTGFTDKEHAQLITTLKLVPAIISPNMSMGVNLLFNLVKQAAKSLPGYDIEIVEAHHNQKKDAPSGTANKIAEIICAELNQDLHKTGIYGREGIIGARKPGQIGILSVRAGDIVGDHTVIFAGTGERIELIHRAHSRDTLAIGAIKASKWLATQKPGLYNMADVLGL
jgi:4-hydroxy-tetrahydrodipicolinate reductase